jgi:hypothetical protein
MKNVSPTSLAVRRPAVAKVLESASGVERDAQDVIGSDTDRLMQMRLSVRTSVLEGEPQYLCAECFTPVYLCCRRSTRHFFFRHSIEDGRCSAITRGELNHDEILAKKYNGAKESLLHRQMKQWVVESLYASGQFADIKQESRWQGSITGKWRQPDVSALYQGLRVAFEIQLSTTFLDVIALRRLFYLKEGGLLFWVFAKFDDGSRRLTMDDVFFNNNQNAFIVSSRTRDASCATADFRLDCIWSIPPYWSSTNEPQLQRQQVSFGELTLDPLKQQAYFFDYAAECQKLQAEYAAERTSWPTEFEHWWIKLADRVKSLDDHIDKVKDFPNGVPMHWSEDNMRHETPLQFYGQDLRLPVAVLDAIYSVKYGRPIGIDRKHFIEVAHWFAPAYPRYLLWFRKALQVWGRGALLTEQDKSGNWAKRVREYKSDMRVNPKKFDADQTHQRLLEWLFPELVPLPLCVEETRNQSVQIPPP